MSARLLEPWAGTRFPPDGLLTARAALRSHPLQAVTGVVITNFLYDSAAGARAASAHLASLLSPPRSCRGCSRAARPARLPPAQPRTRAFLVWVR